MNNIEHKYTEEVFKKCNTCGHNEKKGEVEREYIINQYNLIEIANILEKKHTIIKCDKCNTIEKTKVHTSEIDDLVERFYPDISEVPEGEYHPNKIYNDDGELIVLISGFGGGGYSENVWLDSSHAVENELKERGFNVEY